MEVPTKIRRLRLIVRIALTMLMCLSLPDGYLHISQLHFLFQEFRHLSISTTMGSGAWIQDFVRFLINPCRSLLRFLCSLQESRRQRSKVVVCYIHMSC